MILPIVAYGHPVLKKMSEEIQQDHPGLNELINNMFETMYSSGGIGLAASQVNHSIRLFIIDANPMAEDFPELKGFKQVFINPYILEESNEIVSAEEGCLSIPNIRESVPRPNEIVLEYYDNDWNLIEQRFKGYAARVIQHEYDHVEGILFVEKISPLRKTLISRKLKEISIGKVDVDYKMIFPQKKRN